MKINIKQLKTWIAALDSGEYQQTTHTLQDEKGYCCLGVACAVLIPRDKQYLKFKGFLLGGNPDSQAYAPEWLKEIDNDFKSKTSYYLVDLNDTNDFSFSEIATLLELVYIHKILD